MKKRILVVEDDLSILTGLEDLLTDEGYEVVTAADGEKALELYHSGTFSLILLDIMIPEKSGYEVCNEIRKKDPKTPIVMLTAKTEEVDKVVGLELGADDYVIKPFGVRELLARIKAVLRRASVDENVKNGEPIEFGDVRINPKTFKGTNKEKKFNLKKREIMLLELFSRNEGEVLDRDMLLNEIWGMQYTGTTRTLDQHIAKLRQKIEDDPSNPRHIITVHTIGYKFVKEP
jgi:DNA-binding response OmpR family regulator